MSTTAAASTKNNGQDNIKAVVRGLLDELPDDCTIEDVILALYVRASILESREQINRGEGMTLEAAKKELGAWLQSKSHQNSSRN
ncbi:MAG: hypothetical protein ACREOO_18925 [bacterium]